MDAQMRETLFSSEQQEWETPRALLDKLAQEFNFTLDAAASEANAKFKKFYTAEIDALAQEPGQWKYDAGAGVIWINPPYGRVIAKWTARALAESRLGAKIVMLVPSRTDTKYFHEHLIHGAIRFLPSRLHFELDGKPVLDKNGKPQAAPFPSAIVIFGRRPSMRCWDWRDVKEEAEDVI
jgi:phage N-6-adenine-methyltransferase